MIFYFSGTGNTRQCAATLAALTGDVAVAMSRDMLLAPDSAAVSACGHTDRVVWMFPVYAWGIPPMVRRVMERVVIDGLDEGAVHWMVCTCGDDVGLTAGEWRSVMHRRGWLTRSAFSVEMPNTYVFMKGFDVDSPGLTEHKLAAMPKRLARIAAAIAGDTPTASTATQSASGTAAQAAGIADDVVKGRFAWLKSRVVRPWFHRHAMSPKPFHATDACTGCGTCARACPLGNITVDATTDNTPDTTGGNTVRRPRWGSQCTLCTACYHACPHHAVAYGRSTAAKGQKK